MREIGKLRTAGKREKSEGVVRALIGHEGENNGGRLLVERGRAAVGVERNRKEIEKKRIEVKEK